MQQFPIDNNDRPLIPKGKEIPGFKHLKNPMPEGVKLPKFQLMEKVFLHRTSDGHDSHTDEARVMGILHNPSQMTNSDSDKPWVYLVEYLDHQLFCVQAFAPESELYRAKARYHLWQEVGFYDRVGVVSGIMFGANAHWVEDIGPEWGWTYLIKFSDRSEIFAHEDELQSLPKPKTDEPGNTKNSQQNYDNN